MTVTKDAIRDALIKILKQVQTSCGHADADSITATTRPMLDLENFDSNVALPTIELLALELGITIPKDVNIFVSSDGKKKLTVDEAVLVVAQCIAKGA
jgi:hypothetical protein